MINFVILSLVICALLVLGFAATRAPEGYEDQDGFHLGRQPQAKPGDPRKVA